MPGLMMVGHMVNQKLVDVDVKKWESHLTVKYRSRS